MNTAINTGFSDEDRAAVAAGLSKLLADTYALYLKTHGYHWNVRGPNFQALHTLFQAEYEEQWAALDELAERIRALGEYAPMGYGAFANLTGIKDGDPEYEALAMVLDLKEGHEEVCRTARSIFPAAEKAGDQATMDLITARFTAHEKHAWMLRATLGTK